MTQLTVSQVAKATGLSRETLRYYEREGLLTPQRRPANGYRDYSFDDLERLEFVIQAKRAGFPIRKIKELLILKDRQDTTCRVGREIAIKQIQQVDAQIAALKEVRTILDNFVKACEQEGLDQPCCLTFHLKPVFLDSRRLSNLNQKAGLRISGPRSGRSD